MPIYAYKCPACEMHFDRFLKMKDCDNPQICECGEEAKRQISAVNFNLPGDGWTSKNLRIKKQMRKKNKRLDAKMEERKRDQPVVRLAPNVDGERTESWAEAKKLAKSKGKVAKTYDKKIREEKAGY